jgi:hypothetical protein
MARNEFADTVAPLALGSLFALGLVVLLIFYGVANVKSWKKLGPVTTEAAQPERNAGDERRPGGPPATPAPIVPVPGGPPATPAPIAPPPKPNSPAGAPIPAGTGLVGQWARPSDGLVEVWTVQCPAGRWEVSGRYFDGTEEVGSFVGSDVVVSGRGMSFTHKFVKQPPRAWLSGATITAQLDGSNLAFTWQIGGSSGTGTLTRVER